MICSAVRAALREVAYPFFSYSDQPGPWQCEGGVSGDGGGEVSSLRLHSSDFPGDGLAERLCDRLRLVDLESVDADFERGAAFLDYQAQAGPRRATEVNVKGLVANAADRFHSDARHFRRLAGIEAIDGALASEWLHNGQCCKSAFSYPLARRWTANRCPGVDRYLQRRADLRLCDQRAGFA